MQFLYLLSVKTSTATRVELSLFPEGGCCLPNNPSSIALFQNTNETFNYLLVISKARAF